MPNLLKELSFTRRQCSVLSSSRRRPRAMPEPSAATTANSAVISWTDKLLAIAADGIEVQLAYLPRKFWPNEADENPPNEVWQAWATTVPGTDMCVYGPHKGATPDDAMSALWNELYKGGKAT